jgi:hypothetical protein
MTEVVAMPEAATSTAVRRARIVCAIGALVCAAIFLVSLFAARIHEDQVRVTADEHGLVVCQPDQTCTPPADTDVACAGSGNELCHLADGSIVHASRISYANARPTGWKILALVTGLLGLSLVMFLVRLGSGERRLRKREELEKRRLDRAVWDAEARAAEARTRAAREASAD